MHQLGALLASTLGNLGLLGEIRHLRREGVQFLVQLDQ